MAKPTPLQLVMRAVIAAPMVRLLKDGQWKPAGPEGVKATPGHYVILETVEIETILRRLQAVERAMMLARAAKRMRAHTPARTALTPKR